MLVRKEKERKTVASKISQNPPPHNPRIPDFYNLRRQTMSSIKYLHGDLFTASTGAVLAHSCNCIGSWGGGIALQFKKRFPRAHRAYVDHCKAHAADPAALLGTCLLLEDYTTDSNDVFRIACLFTSVGNSSSLASIKRSPKDVILSATQDAIADLKHQLDGDTTISMPQINAGLFCVPWEETEAVLQRFQGPFHVYVFP